LAYETEKRQWINEQKRLIAEAMQQAGGPDPRWNDHGGKDDGRKGRTAAIEELSAFEIKKRRWMAQHKRSIAEAKRRLAIEETWRRRQVHPVVGTETAGERFVQGSDEAFLKSVLDNEKIGGGSDRWLAERDEADKRRQSYLRNYCPLQREEESMPEEERKPTEPDDDEADGPESVDAEFLVKSVIEKNPWEGRRRSEEYYAKRREVLQNFKSFTGEREKAGVGVPRRSTCAVTRSYWPFRVEEEEEESVPEDQKPEEPDDAEIEQTVSVPPANGPGSVDGESLMKSDIEENPRACRRGDEGYNAMRREVLQSFKFGTGGSDKAGVGATRRGGGTRHVLSFCSRLRAPAAPKICCTG
jgi:hypothetical protein